MGCREESYATQTKPSGQPEALQLPAAGVLAEAGGEGSERPATAWCPPRNEFSSGFARFLLAMFSFQFYFNTGGQSNLREQRGQWAVADLGVTSVAREGLRHCWAVLSV